MSLLVVAPVIVVPRPGVLESWNYDEMLVVINGAHSFWQSICRARPWATIVDEEGRNLGCPKSWNLGFEYAVNHGFTHVLILSQGLAIEGGTRRLAGLVGEHPDVPWVVCSTWQTFHGIVIAVELWETVGPFDETLPVYADVDWWRRMHLSGEYDRRWSERLRVRIPGSDVRCSAFSGGAVTRDLYDDDKLRYVEKWGGRAGHERFRRPWDPTSDAVPVDTRGL